jgi:hypothetical protein
LPLRAALLLTACAATLLSGCRCAEPRDAKTAAPGGARHPDGGDPKPESLARRVTFGAATPGSAARAPLVDARSLPEGQPSFVALIVLDTLRADRTSLCGYPHPTTPALENVVKNGAIHTCEAYSPATWTLPAHASYFTGATTADHGVHTLGTALGQHYETLAERYAAQGYQTVFVSGNPVFTMEGTGFWQGFDRVVAAKQLTGPLRGASFGDLLDAELARLDPTKPLFLVVNIFDAHDPYPPVPEGVPWASAMGRTNLLPHTAKPENPYYAFVTGAMKAEVRDDYLERIGNAYQWSVHEADANLGVLLRRLREDGWSKRPHRVVITSDHGEHLGEHDLLRHGSAAWQTVTRVPFVYLDNTPTAPRSLPEPMSATNAYFLLRDGKLPDEALLVESASANNPEDFKPSWFTVALWPSTTQKLLHFDGQDRLYDLTADPAELHPQAVPTSHPMAALLAERVRVQRSSVDAALARGPDPSVMEMMKAVGYVQDDEPEPASP